MKSQRGIQMLLILLMAVIGSALDSIQQDFLWTCINDKCVRSSGSIFGPIAWESMAICSLVCGRYKALWPHPTGDIELAPNMIGFSPERVKFDLTHLSGGQEAKNMMSKITNIFMKNLVATCSGNITDDPRNEVVINIVTYSSSLVLDVDTDEEYSLNLTTGNSRVTVVITAETLYGARHGLETLSQLTACSPDAGGALRMITDGYVVDKPAFKHRGLMLDTGRNYLTEEAIKRTLDGMAASKLNVLHWHATDSQSFPLQLPRVPNLARYGAYSGEKVYTAETVSRLIDYARIRGIRVLMEFDSPSHAGNGWQWGESDDLGSLAVCVNQQPWQHFCIQPPCGQLNPVNPNLFNVLRNLFADLLSLISPHEMFHMGGDEVFFKCWNATEEIVNWMTEKGMGLSKEDFIELWAEFQDTALQILDEERGNTNTPVIMWSSDLTDPKYIEKYLNKDRYIIQTWVEHSSSIPNELLARGYRLIISTKDTWYLDHGFWGSTSYHNWRKAYSNTILRDKGVLGGEACMWGEYVDENSLDTKVWPRAAAVAERLWSDPTTSADAAQHRLYGHRERLVQRGIKADGLAPGYCYLNEGECQTHY